MKTALISLYIRLCFLGCFCSATTAPGNCNSRFCPGSTDGSLTAKTNTQSPRPAKAESTLLYQAPAFF